LRGLGDVRCRGHNDQENGQRHAILVWLSGE
jgi:hypothetical protein